MFSGPYHPRQESQERGRNQEELSALQQTNDAMILSAHGNSYHDLLLVDR